MVRARRKGSDLVSYSEKDGQVWLSMSLEDWQNLLLTLGYAMGAMAANNDMNSRNSLLQLVNRLNQGNPHYTPYQVEAEKE